MTLEWHKSYLKDYQKLPQRIQQKTDKQLGFLLQDWRHPSLRTKKVQGSLLAKKVVALYEINITMNYRLLFQKTKTSYILLAVGTHDEILGR